VNVGWHGALTLVNVGRHGAPILRRVRRPH